jgi:DMSO/TMAO reductase YedYZ heme-binding membrane subunit
MLLLTNKERGENMKDKIEIALGLVVAILVVMSFAAYVTFSWGIIGYAELGIVAIAVILLGFSAYILWDRARNISKGLPADDERMRNISYKAGYYGFIAAIWTAVGASPVADIFFGHELEGSHVTAVVVIVSGFVFAISYLYLARKGN